MQTVNSYDEARSWFGNNTGEVECVNGDEKKVVSSLDAALAFYNGETAGGEVAETATDESGVEETSTDVTEDAEVAEEDEEGKTTE